MYSLPELRVPVINLTTFWPNFRIWRLHFFFRLLIFRFSAQRFIRCQELRSKFTTCYWPGLTLCWCAPPTRTDRSLISTCSHCSLPPHLDSNVTGSCRLRWETQWTYLRGDGAVLLWGLGYILRMLYGRPIPKLSNIFTLSVSLELGR